MENKRMGWIPFVMTALWGVSEATVFFILPDVPISYAAVRWGFRAGLKLAFVAALAATAGGAAMWWYGAHDAAAARALMLSVPAVGPDLLAKAHDGMASADWPLRLAMGALRGTPYKLYAVEAGAQGIDLSLFVALSIPARLLRFVLTAFIAARVSRRLENRGLAHWRYPALAAVWIAVYAFYWTVRAVA